MFSSRTLLWGIYGLLWPPFWALVFYTSHDAAVLDRWSRRLFFLIVAYACLLLAATAAWCLCAISQRKTKAGGSPVLGWIRRSRLRVVTALAGPVLLWWAALCGLVMVGPAAELGRRLLFAMADLAVAVALWLGWVLFVDRGKVGRREILLRISAVMVSVAAAILFVEIAGRIADIEPLYGWNLNPPNIRVRWKSDEFDTVVTTNSQGLREPAFVEREHLGRFRIVVIGDSITFGQGVNDDETYPRRLQNLLRNEYGWKLAEVVNVSRRGAGPGEYLQYVRLAIENLDPDLLILGYYPLNDCPVRQPYVPRTSEQLAKLKSDILRESRENFLMHSVCCRLLYRGALRPLADWRERLQAGRTPGEPDRIFQTPNELGLALSKPLSEVERERRDWLQQRGWIDRALRRDINPALMVSAIQRPRGLLKSMFLDEGTEPAMLAEWRLCEDVLKEIARLAKDRPSRFCLLVIPHPYQVDPAAVAMLREWTIATSPEMLTSRRQNDLALDFCRRNGIDCVDPLVRFREACAAGEELFYPIDSHMTASGHRLLSQILVRHLAGRLEFLSQPPSGESP